METPKSGVGVARLPCRGKHHYEKECPYYMPTNEYDDGDGKRGCASFRWSDWQVGHLNPCKCGSDTVKILAPGELECDHCGNQVFGNNYDLICTEWNRQNPEQGIHPFVDGNV